MNKLSENVASVPVTGNSRKIEASAHLSKIRLSEAVPMRPFFRAKNGGRCRMHLTRERNLRGKYIFCLFNSTD